MRQSPASFNSVSDCAPCEYKRARRRGPRSSLANLRRALPKRCRALPGVASGESEAPTSVVSSIFQPQPNSSINSGPSPNLNPNAIFKKRNAPKKEIIIFVLNIQCLRAHMVELEYHLELHKPHIVLLQETWLDASTESVTIANYFSRPLLRSFGYCRRVRRPGVCVVACLSVCLSVVRPLSSCLFSSSSLGFGCSSQLDLCGLAGAALSAQGPLCKDSSA